jgi:hypothetical protein
MTLPRADRRARSKHNAFNRLGCTKRIRLTRSLFLGGKHAEKGSVHEVAKPLADDLILEESAVPVRRVWQVVCVVVCVVLGVVLWWLVHLARRLVW